MLAPNLFVELSKWHRELVASEDFSLSACDNLVSKIEVCLSQLAEGTRFNQLQYSFSTFKKSVESHQKALELEAGSLKKSFDSQQRALESLVLQLNRFTTEMQRMNQSRCGETSFDGNNSNGEHVMEVKHVSGVTGFATE